MVWSVFGILLGIIIGFVFNFPIPLAFTKYTAVVIIGLLDAIFGAIRAEITNDKFNITIFISGVFFNAVLAIGITYLGEKLGLNLYLAATVVFTFRIFQNVGITRRVLIENWLKKNEREKKIEKVVWKDE